MSSPPRASPRTRSAFAAAFLSLIFPGLGHAYDGAWTRALAFATPPVLAFALLGGILLRVDRIELLGFVIQPPVLYGLFVVNAIALLYRVIAAVDAWQVARFLNEVDASGGAGSAAEAARSPLSIAGLVPVVLVIAGGHLAVARYNALALGLVNCVFSETTAPRPGARRLARPGAAESPRSSAIAIGPTETPAPTDVGPRRSAAARPAPSPRPCRPGTARSG